MFWLSTLAKRINMRVLAEYKVIWRFSRNAAVVSMPRTVFRINLLIPEFNFLLHSFRKDGFLPVPGHFIIDQSPILEIYLLVFHCFNPSRNQPYIHHTAGSLLRILYRHHLSATSRQPT